MPLPLFGHALFTPGQTSPQRVGFEAGQILGIVACYRLPFDQALIVTDSFSVIARDIDQCGVTVVGNVANPYTLGLCARVAAAMSM
jgi:hypothetical protein